MAPLDPRFEAPKQPTVEPWQAAPVSDDMHDSRSSFGIVWNAWFLSNALTGLTMLPALYLAAQVKRHWNPEADGSRVLELAAAAALLVASCAPRLRLSGRRYWG